MCIADEPATRVILRARQETVQGFRHHRRKHPRPLPDLLSRAAIDPGKHWPIRKEQR